MRNGQLPSAEGRGFWDTAVSSRGRFGAAAAQAGGLLRSWAGVAGQGGPCLRGR